MKRVRNSDLVVGEDRLSAWNQAHRRRKSFHNLHLIHKAGISFRSANVLDLNSEVDPAVASITALAALTSLPVFSAIAVLHGDRIIHEQYALDFGPNCLHSIQSITKTTVHLIIGSLVEEGRVKLDAPISHYLPEIGPGYANATVQQALDMDVDNNFEDDYAAPYSPAPKRGEPTGYAREEIAMGWRLPPEHEPTFSVRDFAKELESTGTPSTSGLTRYKSANTDVLGWVAEVASGRSLIYLLADIIDAAGIEGSFHISMDCAGVPVLSGGGVMSARDLARYGLLLAKPGRPSNSSLIGSPAFLSDAMSGAGTQYEPGSSRIHYRNHLFATSEWAGHAGYGGQFLMMWPAKNAAAAFFSVLETPYGDEAGYFSTIIEALEQLAPLF